MPSRLLIAEETLKTNDKNQNKLTTLPNGVFESGSENWRVVAVTLEKKVAMVVIFTYRVVALSFSSARKAGRAKENTSAWHHVSMSDVHFSPNDLNSSPTAFISLSSFANTVLQM